MIYVLLATKGTLRLQCRHFLPLVHGAMLHSQVAVCISLHPKRHDLDLPLRASQKRGARITGDDATLDVKPSMCKACQAVEIMTCNSEEIVGYISQSIDTGGMENARRPNNDVARIWIHCN